MSSSFLNQFVVNPGDDDDDWLNADFSDPVPGDQDDDNGDNTDNDNVSDLDADFDEVGMAEATQLHQVGYYDPDGVPYGHVYTRENVNSPRLDPSMEKVQLIDTTLDDDYDDEETNFPSPFSLMDAFYRHTMQKRITDANRQWGFLEADLNNTEPDPELSERKCKVKFSVEVQYFTALEVAPGSHDPTPGASTSSGSRLPLQTILKEAGQRLPSNTQPCTSPRPDVSDTFTGESSKPGTTILSQKDCPGTSAHSNTVAENMLRSQSESAEPEVNSTTSSGTDEFHSMQTKTVDKKEDDKAVLPSHSLKTNYKDEHNLNDICTASGLTPKLEQMAPSIEDVKPPATCPLKPEFHTPKPHDNSISTPSHQPCPRPATPRGPIKRIPTASRISQDKKTMVGGGATATNFVTVKSFKSQIYPLNYEKTGGVNSGFSFVGPKQAVRTEPISPILMSVLDPKVLLSLSKTVAANSPVFKELKLQIMRHNIDKSMLESMLSKKLLQLIYDIHETNGPADIGSCVKGGRDFHKDTLSSRLKMTSKLARPRSEGQADFHDSRSKWASRPEVQVEPPRRRSARDNNANRGGGGKINRNENTRSRSGNRGGSNSTTSVVSKQAKGSKSKLEIGMQSLGISKMKAQY